MPPVHVLAALLLGALIPLQAGANARLSRSLADGQGSAWAASTVNFLVGLAVILVVLFSKGGGLAAFKGASSAPWWAWIGGLIGAAFVAGTVVCIPRLGAAEFLALAVLGQMLFSLAADHFGLVGLAVREVTPLRLLGVLLVAGGVALIKLK